MKKIIKSFAIIIAVSAIVTGATMSFFSDEEKSKGNTFTAGAIDLEVDSTAHYNGCVCDDGTWDCEPWADFVVDLNQGDRKDTSPVVTERSDPSQALGEPDGSISPVHFLSLGFSGEIEIGFANKIINESGNDLKLYEVTGGSSYPDEVVQVEFSQDGDSWSLASPSSVVKTGEVDLDSLDWAKFVRITDISDKNDFPQGNADGYDLDGLEALHCECTPDDLETTSCEGSWELGEFGPTSKFFNIDDIKPGDRGENTVSLHVLDNDAYACLLIDGVENDENDLIDPEEEAGDTSESDGELAENLKFFAWSDDGDNIWEDGELPLFDPLIGTGEGFIGGRAYPLFVPQTEVLTAEETKFVGLAWCLGWMEVDETIQSITCDGTTDMNDAQTDSFNADLTFYVEQARNNENFNCSPLD